MLQNDLQVFNYFIDYNYDVNTRDKIMYKFESCDKFTCNKKSKRMKNSSSYKMINLYKRNDSTFTPFKV